MCTYFYRFIMFILQDILEEIDHELIIEENSNGFIVSGNSDIQDICKRFLEQGYLIVLCSGGAIFPKSIWDNEYEEPLEIKEVSFLEKIMNFCKLILTKIKFML